MKKILGSIITVVLAVVLVGCAGGKNKQDAIKIGVVGENNEVWEHVQKELEKQDITLDIVSFSDYNQPNAALADGELDLNSFQHQIFLDNYNAEHQTDLVSIGKTVIAPLGIYSTQLTSLDELKEGDEVTIPNDVTNGGRALILLQTAGLIKLSKDSTQTPTVKDITENRLNLKITELDAAQVARTLEDAKIAIINSGLAVDAGFIPTEDAVFLEPVDEKSDPYINIIVARKEDKGNETYQKIVKAYQQESTKKAIAKTSKGSSIPAW
ncbi:MetQ/NlpA family ABC transporter substrate-binding protein [Vagococcus lutrae]|uniref:MetQ/NlpA family ABC transporter substrate-binding protein n=1 Tax=Vagococcus lutrae TaxID=81947 RepID=UPI00200C8390|nr:MetQ/NlpA family ABC transporter substrate-binding protein [Vagococcus lutrae]MDT2823241.1 MetQ/NlpA family ABC transporter substrate-binding protein [Vagococcus lutrae]UQF19012.1 MetQ/NlpA family ABC transporter substrate-binding protein [Vagococcus lutrae]